MDESDIESDNDNKTQNTDKKLEKNKQKSKNTNKIEKEKHKTIPSNQNESINNNKNKNEKIDINDITQNKKNDIETNETQIAVIISKLPQHIIENVKNMSKLLNQTEFHKFVLGFEINETEAKQLQKFWQ